MPSPTTFRCPFEVQGEAEGVIKAYAVPHDPSARLNLYAEALKAFYAEPSLQSMRFVFHEEDLDTCKNLEELHDALLPYQCELLAAEVTYRLYPFLPYQPYKKGLVNNNVSDPSFPYLASAYSLVEMLLTLEKRDILNELDLAHRLSAALSKARAEGIQNASFVIYDATRVIPGILLKLMPGNLVIEYERDIAPNDPSENRNIFGIVKCPLYPKEFGRYGDAVEIVYTREAHFAALSVKTRRQIRQQSNKVLQNAKVKIFNLSEDKQCLGLWIP